VVSAYDAEIVSMDRGFGRLIDGLRERDLYRDAVIVLTSDHGEEFGEHGWIGWHSHTLFEELIRVPLLVKLPGNRRAGGKVAGQVRGIDLAPTILDLVDLESPETFDGMSLLPAIDARRTTDPPAAGLWRETPPHEAEPAPDGIRRQGWKMVEGRLHDLRADPWELRDASTSAPDQRSSLEHELERLLARRSPLEPEQAHPGPETLEQLRSLGYVQDPPSAHERD
jgi:arylsulfatase A-like enzyme